ncbi:MAG: sulfate permease [Saprospiraceae bacterium]|nr:sulfate permease [Saprospiraceae bacterium]
MFTPKLVSVLKEGYSWKQLQADLTAGTIVGIVALPLAIAFAIASGVTPDKGLVTAVIAGFLISVLGGSRVQIGGPTGAFVPIVYGIVQQYGLDGLIISTFMAGIILIIMGFARFGSVIKYISHSVIVGFTSGIALIIFSSQIKDFFGLKMDSVPTHFHEKWWAYFSHFDSINPWAVAIAVGTIALSLLFTHFKTKIPGSLFAIILSTLAVQLFNLPVDTIVSRFGDIPNTIPAPSIPALDFDTLQNLLKPALTIALLGAIESLLSAVVADAMTGSSHRSNMELVAQGVGNMASSIFGGIPATGAIARTATNIKNGGRSPISGMTHAVVLLLIMLFAGQWAKLIPLSCLAGILVVVAYNMSEWHTFKALLKGSRSDVAVLLTTFFLTVVFDLTIAIEVGIMMSVFLFMYNMSKVSGIEQITGPQVNGKESDDPFAITKYKLAKGIEVFEINGALFFGMAHKFKETMGVVERNPKVLILRMRKVSLVDASGINSLREFIKRMQHAKIKIVLSGVQPHVREELDKSGLIDMVGSENVLPHISPAVDRAHAILEEIQST